VVVVAVAVGVLGFHVGSASHRPAQASPTTIPPPAAPDAGAAANAIALQLTVQPQDLSSQWVSVQSANYPLTVANAPSACLSGIPVGNRSAGALSQYSRDLQANGLESGDLTSTAFLQASDHDAAITRTRVESPGYDACLQAEVVSDLDNEGATSVAVAAVSSLPTPAGFAGVAERLSLTFMSGHTADTGIADNVDFVQGRVEFRMVIFQCSCAPLDAGLESSLVQTVSSRIQASSFGH